MAVTMKIDQHKYFFNALVSKKDYESVLAKGYQFQFYGFGVRIWPKGADTLSEAGSVYCATGVPTLSVCEGKLSPENKALLKDRLFKAFNELATLMAKDDIIEDVAVGVKPVTPPKPENLTPSVYNSIIAYLWGGNKVWAIKQYREATGLSLKESKDYCDSLEKALGITPEMFGQGQPPSPTTKQYTSGHPQDIVLEGSDEYKLTGVALITVQNLIVKDEIVSAIKYVRTVTGVGLKPAKEYVDFLKQMMAHGAKLHDKIKEMPDDTPDHLVSDEDVGIKPKHAEPVSGTNSKKVKLIDATAIGQPVFGTNTESTYYVIAMTSTVKMAARLVDGEKLSVRVEGTPTTKERMSLQAMGLDKGGGDSHWSTHFGLNAVPLPRVIGSIIFGADIEWHFKVNSAAELKKVIHA